MPRLTRRCLSIAATLLPLFFVSIAAVGVADAQYGRRGWGWRRTPPRLVSPGESDRAFVFGRGMYDSVRREWLGTGWNTDYPDSDYNFMIRLFGTDSHAGQLRWRPAEPRRRPPDR